MFRSRFVAATFMAGLLLGSVLATSGCTQDSSQPARESISAPRKGATSVTSDAATTGPGKGKVVGGKLGGKGAD
jgi:hypothetical protein